MIEGQPDAPAVVIEDQRKEDRNHQEQGNGCIRAIVYERQCQKEDQQYYGFGRHHVDKYCPNKKSFFAFEDSPAF
jgi:hypothetical protein